MAAMDDLTDCVHDLLAQIPTGRVSTYGRLGDEARWRCGRGSARQVARVLSAGVGELPWWRVVPASGVPAAPVRAAQLAHLRAEGTAFRTPERVDLARALHDFTDAPRG